MNSGPYRTPGDQLKPKSDKVKILEELIRLSDCWSKIDSKYQMDDFTFKRQGGHYCLYFRDITIIDSNYVDGVTQKLMCELEYAIIRSAIHKAMASLEI
jgi:hypothetical protein